MCLLALLLAEAKTQLQVMLQPQLLTQKHISDQKLRYVFHMAPVDARTVWSLLV